MYRKLYVDGCVDIVCNALKVQSPLTLEQLCQIIQEKLPGSCVPKDNLKEDVRLVIPNDSSFIIVNNGHGLLYNHVIALEDEISFVAALIVLILSIPKAVDTFAKQSKIVKSISFISKVLALLIILMIPYLKDFVLLKKLMSVLDTNILLILILFFAYAGQWAAEIKRKDIKNGKALKKKGNSNEELP